MRKQARLSAMMIAMALAGGCVPTHPAYRERSKEWLEIEEVSRWLKCTLEELYEKCKNNPKLLSKYANIALRNYMKSKEERP